ncbi:MAG: hypothetical protein VZQ28_01335 [Methanomethylophilus sp.]|nr:hypothetical protein [Methanomethylophilus sp.]
MITVAELLKLMDGADFDVYDNTIETGFECAYELHEPDPNGDRDDYYYDAVCAWIQNGVEVVSIGSGCTVTADIWSFVKRHIDMFKRISEHAADDYKVRGDDDDSITAGIAICQCLEVGNWPYRDYERIARLIEEAEA